VSLLLVASEQFVRTKMKKGMEDLGYSYCATPSGGLEMDDAFKQGSELTTNLGPIVPVALGGRL
jgi:hypothetical protein